MTKINREVFINMSNEIHNFLYDYSKFEFIDINTKGIVICKLHGEFMQDYTHHVYRKQKCPRCSGKGITTEEIVQIFINVHGYLYDYSKVKYIKNTTKVIIICKEHGEFSQTYPAHAFQKQKCPKCQRKAKLSLLDFINISNIIHNHKYNYSKFIYKNNKTKGIIICKKHGEFLQTPGHHMYSKNGCPGCVESHGEKIIKTILKTNNINYEPQKKFSDCRGNSSKTYPGGRLLSFDFFIDVYNLCIEFDGIYHFSEKTIIECGLKIPNTYSTKNYIKHNTNDSIKTEYCKNNKINLLRILFFNEKLNKKITKEEIETLIKDFINSLESDKL